MMKTRITKIFVFALTFALLIGAAIGFSASADNEALEIVSQNVSYEGKTHLYFAVSYENVADPEAIELVVTYTDDEGATQTVTVSESEALTLKDGSGNDVACRAFRTPGVDAKNFTKVFTVKAILGNAESASKNYSVTEYCNQWLAYIAGVAEPSAKELKIKAACEATLAYGTKIQALLDYYPAGNTADYPENYVYVKGVDGVTVNGAKTACVIKGTEVALGYEGTVASTGYDVSDLAGSAVAVANGKFTAAASCVAAPILSDAKGEYFLSSESGSRWDYDTITTLNPDTLVNNGVTEGDVTVKTGSFSIENGSLKFEDGEAQNSDMIAKYWRSYPSSYNVTIFEFDMKLDQSYGSYPIQIKLANLTHTIYYPKIDGANRLAMKVNNVDTALGIPMKQWATIRFEHYYDENVLKVFVNNEFVFDIATSTGTKGQTPMIYLTSNERKTASNADLWIDNVYVGHLTKTFVSGNPKAAE